MKQEQWTSVPDDPDMKALYERIRELTEQRDRLLEVCRQFDAWFYGWCPSNDCCASSGLPVHNAARNAIAACEDKQ